MLTKICTQNIHAEFVTIHVAGFSYGHQHLATRKHQNANKNMHSVLDGSLQCKNCNRVYKHRSSLCRHERQCQVPKVDMPTFMLALQKESSAKDQLVAQLAKQNQLIESMIPRLGNNNNNRVNVNVFLNEKCKNAINITDFVESVEVGVRNLAFMGEHGLTEGISSVLIDELGKLDTSLRPIHCTDLKRETLYVKDNDRWAKELGGQKLKGLIGTVAAKHIDAIPKWEAANKGWELSESETDAYLRYVRLAMERIPEEEKARIIRAIARSTAVLEDGTPPSP